jgi:hypothetical protein
MMIPRSAWSLLSLSLALTLACSTGSDDATPDGEDAPAVDGVEEASDSDGGSTVADVDVEPGVLDRMCAPDELALEPVTWPESRKFSLSVYHFNLQYVAGGIQNFLGQPNMSDEELQDLIITESFEPLVALFEQHPEWGGSFEMQGLFLQVLAERFPELLLRFGRVVRSGQVDLMSFHYSDQLFLAYPYRDQLWSWRQNERLLESMCLPPSPAFFTQEGQYGPGMVAFIAQHNGGVSILPRNQLSFNIGEPRPRALWFDRDGAPVITTDGFVDEAEGWALDWNFVDDAELLATNGINPYFPSGFVASPEAIARYEEDLQALTDEGYLVTTIREYRRQLEAADVPRAPLPPVHDGQWQSDAGDNLFQWMGFGAGWAGDERDNAILTGNVRISRQIRATEILLELAEGQGEDVGDLREWLDGAVRELLLAEVSDSTGWRPYIVEISYSLDHAAEALKRTQTVQGEVLFLLGVTPPCWIDLDSAELRTENPPMEPPPLLDEPPLPMTIDDGGRGAEVRVQDHYSHVEIWITLPAREPATAGSERPEPIVVTFPEELTHLIYSPALLEDEVLSTPFTGYVFEVDHEVEPRNRICLGAPNGLIGMGGDRWLIKDTAYLHVAACVSTQGVSFEDQTQPHQEPASWRFLYFEGSEEDALALAWRTNIEPLVSISLP